MVPEQLSFSTIYNLFALGQSSNRETLTRARKRVFVAKAEGVPLRLGFLVAA